MAKKKAASKKTSAKKAVAKKATVKKATSKKATSKKAAAKKAAAKKATAKKAAPKKAAPKKAAPKKAAPKKAAPKKVAPKKATPKKAATKKAATKKKTGTAASGKPKIEIHFAPKNFSRHVAPGVRIEKETKKKAVKPQEPNEAGPKERKLSAREVAKIREQLVDKRETLLAEIRHQLEDTRKRNSTLASDSADRAADSYDGEISYEMAAAGSRELEKIAAALEKMDKGTYGQCEDCGCHIGRSRLKVLPFAIMCTRCRQSNEMATKKADGSIWGFLDANAEDDL
ncbi:MAG: TraR/DksA family transcriptional regulator [Planctomycetota bacterium]